MVRQLAHEHKPKLIVAGTSAYSRQLDFKKFKEIADEVGAKLMVDMAHIAGLVQQVYIQILLNMQTLSLQLLIKHYVAHVEA